MKLIFSCPLFAGLLFCLLLALPNTVRGQDLSAEEAALRTIIEEDTKGKPAPMAADAIFVSGAIEYPVVGEEQRKTALAESNQKAQRTNIERKSKVERLVLSQSADMAYEYGSGHMSFDTKEGHIEFDNAYLRVWQKLGKQWQVAAVFFRKNGKQQ